MGTHACSILQDSVLDARGPISRCTRCAPRPLPHYFRRFTPKLPKRPFKDGIKLSSDPAIRLHCDGSVSAGIEQRRSRAGGYVRTRLEVMDVPHCKRKTVSGG